MPSSSRTILVPGLATTWPCFTTGGLAGELAVDGSLNTPSGTAIATLASKRTFMLLMTMAVTATGDRRCREDRMPSHKPSGPHSTDAKTAHQSPIAGFVWALFPTLFGEKRSWVWARGAARGLRLSLCFRRCLGRWRRWLWPRRRLLVLRRRRGRGIVSLPGIPHVLGGGVIGIAGIGCARLRPVAGLGSSHAS